ncbi:MAG: DnaJ domain-containing protein [Magnetovibrionaceae bacterium]
MIAWFVLGLALLAGFLLMLRWFVNAEPKAVLKGLKWAGASVFALVAGFLLLTGKLAWIFMALAALLPWFMRARALANGAKIFRRMSGGAAGPRKSDIETDYLRMDLDHETGRLSGEVLKGEFQGAQLADLSLADLARLWRFLETADPPSARLVESFLDRAHPDWRNAASQGGEHGQDGPEFGPGAAGKADNGTMTRDEAFAILGLEPGAGSSQIKEAYHRLIASLHPDKGGSTYLAAKINQAKDLLLRS